jgi:uncharacterized DUF497 family protein
MPEGAFEWDDPRDERGNTRHVGRHGVTPAEAEQALLDPYGFDAPGYATATEERYAYVGATEAGRVLFVVYTERDERIRIITAYRAEPNEYGAYIARRAGYR